MTVTFVRVPEERLAVVIGARGATKRDIERLSGTRLTVLAEDHSVRIQGPDGGDPWGALKAREVVTALGRGFSPPRAFRLFQEERYLMVLDMKEISGKRTKDALRRLRSRLIGHHGRARERLEELSGCLVSVYGTSVALIGSDEELLRGRRAVTMLLRGSEHSAVFHYLERARLESRLAVADLGGEVLSDGDEDIDDGPDRE
jgi:ribosomal RNA assembly protein